MRFLINIYENFYGLFPTKLSFFIFTGYILLFINQGILVTASKSKNNEYNYNFVTVVLLTEVLKLVISIGLYCKDHAPVTLITEVASNWKVLILYFIPAFLYCLYNNLSFVNLSYYDPTTYYLLLQFRVVITGILFQLIFKKHLSKKQWLSLCLLTCGCMIKQFNFGDLPSETSTQTSDTHATSAKTLSINVNAIFLLIQIVCSCLAGVYNEYLLKNDGSNVNIYVNNVFMYLDSIVCNVFILVIQGDVSNVFDRDQFPQLSNVIVWSIIVNNAIVGIITSFFLRLLNSIVKTFASAIELIFTAILCYFIFAIPIYANTVAAIVLVSVSVVIYTQNPIKNPPVTTTPSTEALNRRDTEMV